ncbi:xanthine dehydrogenase small subunit [Marinobacterium sp. D7]|uniref:xanthine dehydrogenase small subunit n=1 Tax=Marinobacterium ramblicola TaxID=2849041 RepID=UPI001C2D0FEE|nr:xanthine dehydrogenase small subunit [Marinobacterium ramblicola]MBV1788117.1 xanthine dehydrogenase small subunit [Marinobacterium ramblicola]
MIRFLFNEQEFTLDECSPELTILEYLRTVLVRRGTKEGCASGDCGACTVVVAEPDGERLRYSTLNSCITFVGTLHGKLLLTVEHLQSSGQLHPVQQAMVDLHGSQCGFCTPGFIMSMFALYKSIDSPSRSDIERALAGNLCRCTGYRPIIDAALSLAGRGGQDGFSSHEALIGARLRKIREDHPSGSLQLGDHRFFVPASSDELAAQLQAYPGAQMVAGGTDLALSVTQQLEQPKVLIYTGAVAELNAISETEGSLLVGGAVSYTRLEPFLQKHYPEFGHLLDRLGSLQIRNQGTLAGNVANASPIGDTPPVLLALGAKLHLRSGNRCQVIGIDDFFTGYRQTALPENGFIEQIEIPLQPEQLLKVFKVSKRLDDDISAVCAAFSLRLEQGIVTEARLGFGGMAATPARALNAEKALIGQPFTERGIEAAQQALGQDFSPIDDVRATAEYRLLVARNLLLRAVLEQDQRYASQPLEVVQYA